MSRVKTFVFLLTCLLVGVGVALLLEYHKRGPVKPPTEFEVAPAAALPEVRGVTLSELSSRRLVRAREMGANYVLLDAAVLAEQAGGEETLAAVVAGAREWNIKFCLVMHVGLKTDVEMLAKTGQDAGVDLLALRPAVAESGTVELDEDFWRKALGVVRKEFRGKVVYVAGAEEYPSVSWWDAVDYVGVTGPFALATVAHPTAYQLQAGMNTQIGSVQTFCQFVKKDAILFEVSYPPTEEAAVHPEEGGPNPGVGIGALQKLCYQAALVGTKGQRYFAGLFLGAEPDPLLSRELGETIRGQWAGASMQAGTGAKK